MGAAMVWSNTGCAPRGASESSAEQELSAGALMCSLQGFVCGDGLRGDGTLSSGTLRLL